MGKYEYVKVLQQNNGYGWDDLEEFETNSAGRLSREDRTELARLQKEYRIAQPFASLRTVQRRIPRENLQG